MNVFSFVENRIQNLCKQYNWPDTYVDIRFSDAKKNQGHINTTCAMKISASTQIKIKDIADLIIADISQDINIVSAKFAPNGFINIELKQDFWACNLLQILNKNQNYLLPNIGNNKKVNIEYVSANPTGPLHIGHARSAIFGNALARLLSKCGFCVTKEFYVNDAGGQINKLAKAVLIRYENILLNKNDPIPKDLYQGEYLQDIASQLIEKYKNTLLEKLEEEAISIIKKFSTKKILDVIKQDLNALGVEHDLFFFESELYKSNQIEQTLQLLKEEDLIYEDYIDNPHGKEYLKNNNKVKHLLFKTTKFGDDQDRALTKEDGSYSYFGSEVAYINNKILRNFDYYFTILGADHIGYISRFCAAFDALSDSYRKKISKVKEEQSKPQNLVLICQLVKYIKGGELVKMSKRSGFFETVKDIIKLIPKEVIQYVMVSKKNDTPIDFDIEKALEQSKANPIFYIQYANVRATSAIKKGNEKYNQIQNLLKSPNNLEFSLIQHTKEIELIIRLVEWHTIVYYSATKHEPHRIATYLNSLACSFHELWDYSFNNTPYRFITNEISVTALRLSLAQATLFVLKEGLDILGIEAKEEM